MKKPKEIIEFAGLGVHFYLDNDDTNGQSCVFKCVVQPGAKMGVPHYHESFDETVYGLKGVITYMVNGEPVHLSDGDPLFVARGVPHGFINNGTEPAEFLCVTNSNSFGPQYFRDIAAVFNAGAPPDVPRLKEIMLTHGLVPVMG